MSAPIKATEMKFLPFLWLRWWEINVHEERQAERWRIITTKELLYSLFVWLIQLVGGSLMPIPLCARNMFFYNFDSLPHFIIPDIFTMLRSLEWNVAPLWLALNSHAALVFAFLLSRCCISFGLIPTISSLIPIFIKTAWSISNFKIFKSLSLVWPPNWIQYSAMHMNNISCGSGFFSLVSLWSGRFCFHITARSID